MGQTHSVFKKIKTEKDVVEELDFSYQRLTALPPLPPGLKNLHCSENQLIVLPLLPSGLKELYFGDSQLKYKGTTIEKIRKEQEEERKNIWMTNLIVFRKVKQEMVFCEETNFYFFVKNIISHF